MTGRGQNEHLLIYEGSNFFRQRLILATLSNKPTRIRGIRSNTDSPGLTEYEASFIRLLDKLSNGSRIEVNETGTCVFYKPGFLVGGNCEHNCPAQRAIGYFLEPLFMLAPFCKKPVNITFKGVTNNQLDPSIDMIRMSLLPVLKKFLVVDEGLELKLIKRGLPPAAGGVVTFSCPTRRDLKPFQWLEYGMVKRVRGTAFTSRVTPTVANRMLASAKGQMLKFLTDVYLRVDNSKCACPGYGVSLVAETNKGTFYSAEAVSNPRGEGQQLPEEIGELAAQRLLEEVCRGGCTDALSQPLLLAFMALSSKDISKAIFGPLTPYSMHFLRHLRDFFKVTFKIDEFDVNKSCSVMSKAKGSADEESGEEEDGEESRGRREGADKLLLTCVGVGFTNLSKGTV